MDGRYLLDTNILIALLNGDDAAVAREYGSVKWRLKVKGRPIPENDIWIAAAALRHGLTLVTRDAHFLCVEGLSLAEWQTTPAHDAQNGS